MINISSTGDNCLLVAGHNTCTSVFSKNFDLATDTIEEIIAPATKQAGSITINIDMCSLERADACATRSHRLAVAPGQVAALELVAPYTRVVRDSVIPLLVFAADQFGNTISQTTDSFAMQVSSGTINNSPLPYEFSQFDRRTFLFHAPAEVNGNVDVTYAIRPLNSEKGLPTLVETFTVSEPFVSLFSGNIPSEKIIYTLPETLENFSSTDSHGIEHFATEG